MASFSLVVSMLKERQEYNDIRKFGLKNIPQSMMLTVSYLLKFSTNCKLSRPQQIQQPLAYFFKRQMFQNHQAKGPSSPSSAHSEPSSPRLCPAVINYPTSVCAGKRKNNKLWWAAIHSSDCWVTNGAVLL